MTNCDVAPATNIVDSKIDYDIISEDGTAIPAAPATKPKKEEKPKTTKKTDKKTKKAGTKPEKNDKKKKDKPWWEKAVEVGKEALPDI